MVKRPVIYQIYWDDGGKTAELYNTKALARQVYNQARKRYPKWTAKIVKKELPRADIGNVWVRYPSLSYNSKTDKHTWQKGKWVYRQRAVRALQASEKKFKIYR